MTSKFQQILARESFKKVLAGFKSRQLREVFIAFADTLTGAIRMKLKKQTAAALCRLVSHQIAWRNWAFY